LHSKEFQPQINYDRNKIEEKKKKNYRINPKNKNDVKGKGFLV